MEFCDKNPDCGLWYRLDQTTSQFTFANSESASCKQKIVVCMYDVDYAVQSTEFDIVEQGEVSYSHVTSSDEESSVPIRFTP